ncbi:MAG: hypothetical protein R2795_07320 [Saprospiraceae bacterium]
MAANETVTLQPTTSYVPETKFGFIENFEDNTPRAFIVNLSGDTEISRTQDDVFEGSYSGSFTLNKTDRPVVEFSTFTTFSGLQAISPYVYLEVNYKSAAPVAWGIVGETDPITGIERYFDPGFTPRDDWNKIYFDLSKLVNDSQLDEFQIAFQAFLIQESPDTARVLLDNIKLVHF